MDKSIIYTIIVFVFVIAIMLVSQIGSKKKEGYPDQAARIKPCVKIVKNSVQPYVGEYYKVVQSFTR